MNRVVPSTRSEKRLNIKSTFGKCLRICVLMKWQPKADKKDFYGKDFYGQNDRKSAHIFNIQNV